MKKKTMYWKNYEDYEYYLYHNGIPIACIDKTQSGQYYCQIYGFGELVREKKSNLKTAKKFCEQEISKRLNKRKNRTC